ncbi:NPR2-domain-containing protein [Auricularia subglabra TFB-10046 SS5]|nr:NPR2-domain-containing protein [Auricularia subglabra TFB-10046 SS5]
MAPTNTFLPRIVSVFYAIFHEKHGHQIVYQVPEGLIAAGSSATAPRQSTPHTPASPTFSETQLAQPQDSSHSVSPALSPERSVSTTSTRSSPRKQNGELCGRLLTISVRDHAVLGFPVRVEGHATYKRTFFQYNVCFVFDGARSAELAPYEPVVRKVGRVLASCEQESSFLSTPETAKGMHAILEQLYEDLNSYAEASIQLDSFNSLELKVFPFFPNPKPVHDWSVPVPLVDFGKRTDASWDITIQRVYPHIDGINHVAKIAFLSESDVGLVREAVAHLLYYQTVLLIDIFQYSNVYALRRPLTWLATSKWVILECGAYVAPPNQAPLDWPTLLEMYTHFAGGTSVKDWIERAGAIAERVDARRFVSFGVIKGFLRRIHRYPYLISNISSANSDNSTQEVATTPAASRPVTTVRGFATVPAIPSPPIETSSPITHSTPPRRKGSTATDPRFERGRRLSSATTGGNLLGSFERLPEGRRASLLARGALTPVPGSPRSAGLGRQPLVLLDDPQLRAITDARRRILDAHRSAAQNSPVSPDDTRLGSGSGGVDAATRAAAVVANEDEDPPPDDLVRLLNGQHHTDRICVQYGVSWAVLEKWFASLKQGKVRIVYR